ncbi:hypothetical protein GWK47_007338 [Chionoecetes opilio]|uniref:Uncharacterized protein n=1 Tax=Chionoecetes opilio TaxID=41210 RepID=A0A8J4Y175_CHIOP|nr:hypothetical protein GWK47_007338 [Chionoecetes opilio]
MTNQEDNEFLLANGSQDVEEGWAGRRFRPCCSGDEAISFAWKKAPAAFSAPQNKKRLPLLICGAARVLAVVPAPTHSAVGSDEEYGALEDASPAKLGRKRARKTSSLQHWRPRWTNQAEESVPRHTCGMKPHALPRQQNKMSKSSTSTAHPSDAQRLKTSCRPWPQRSEEGFGQALRWWSTGMASS